MLNLVFSGDLEAPILTLFSAILIVATRIGHTKKAATRRKYKRAIPADCPLRLQGVKERCVRSRGQPSKAVRTIDDLQYCIASPKADIKKFLKSIRALSAYCRGVYKHYLHKYFLNFSIMID